MEASTIQVPGANGAHPHRRGAGLGSPSTKSPGGQNLVSRSLSSVWCAAPTAGAECRGSGPQVREFGDSENPALRPATPLLSPSVLLPFRGFTFLPSTPGQEEGEPQTNQHSLHLPARKPGARLALSHSRKGRRRAVLLEAAAASP